MEEEKEKKYPVLDKRFAELESQITPILSKAPLPQGHAVSEEITRNVDHLNHLLTTELNQDPASDRAGTKHLKKMVRRVQLIKKILNDWPQSQPSSSSVVSTQPPMCPNTGEDYDHEEGDDVYNDYDHEQKGTFSLMGFKVRDNPIYDGEDDTSDGVTIIDATALKWGSEEMECISDDQDEGVKDEEEMIKANDLQKDKLKKAGGGDTKVNEVKNDYYCYKVAFCILVFLLVLIIVIAVFSDFTDYHSPAVFPTPT